MKNMVTKRRGRLLVIRQNDRPPAEPEWDEALNHLDQKDQDFAQLRALVVTDGGAPTAAQRKRMQNALHGRAIFIAVVSDSVKVRFTASTVALLTSRIQTFTKAEFAQAAAHLKLNEAEEETARRWLAEMEQLVTEG